METQTNITPPTNNSSGANTVLLVVIIILLIGGGYWWYAHRRAQPAQNPGINLNVTIPTSNQNTPSN